MSALYNNIDEIINAVADSILPVKLGEGMFSYCGGLSNSMSFQDAIEKFGYTERMYEILVDMIRKKNIDKNILREIMNSNGLGDFYYHVLPKVHTKYKNLCIHPEVTYIINSIVMQYLRIYLDNNAPISCDRSNFFHFCIELIINDSRIKNKDKLSKMDLTRSIAVIQYVLLQYRKDLKQFDAITLHVMKMMGYFLYLKNHENITIQDGLAIRMLISYLMDEGIDKNIEKNTKTFNKDCMQINTIKLCSVLLEAAERTCVLRILNLIKPSKNIQINPAKSKNIKNLGDKNHDNALTHFVFCIDPRFAKLRTAIEHSNDNYLTYSCPADFHVPAYYSNWKHRKNMYIGSDDKGIDVSSMLQSDNNAYSDSIIAYKEDVIGIALTWITSMWYMHYKYNKQHRCNILTGIEHVDIAYDFLKDATLNEHAICGKVFVFGHFTSAKYPACQYFQCAACNGESGEVHVKIICSMLNKQDVRDKLNNHYGCNIHFDAEFIPMLYDTYNGVVHTITSQDTVHQDIINAVSHIDDRDNDYGLFDHAMLVVGDREIFRKCDFNGKAFLYSYSDVNDSKYQRLSELLRNALNITHALNMRYFLSSLLRHDDLENNLSFDNIMINENLQDINMLIPSYLLKKSDYHLPLRLSVIVAANPEFVEYIDTTLFDNGWMSLISYYNEEYMMYYNGQWERYQKSRRI